MTDLVPFGAEANGQGVHYRVWAPQSPTLQVEILNPDQSTRREVSLQAEDGGYFHGYDAAGKAGDLYKYRLADGQRLPDPATRWQPQGVHGPSMVIDPQQFAWTDSAWQRPSVRDLVIYELHVGTFTPEGTFRAAIARLQHIRDLGATAIELMPLADFAGERNWGYDGVCLFAPAHAYGHPDDLRALVDAAHGLGLAVILDVVYNHFGPDGNYLHAYIGEYLNEEQKTPWGGAIRYGDPQFKPLRDLVRANPAYWMREFHVDGFRLDATHEIYDASPRHLLQELTASIHERGGFAIAEDPRNDPSLVTPEAAGGFGFDAVWADDFHHTVRVANTRENESYLGNFRGTLGEAVDTLRHGWHYRGQVAHATGTRRGGECAHVAPECFVHCISNHDQTGNHAFGARLDHLISPEAARATAALLCLAPYTPMLFMGQEWATSTPFCFFTDHNAELGKLIIEGRRTEFSHFSAFNDPDVLQKIPSPQDTGTFTASKLAWAELDQAPHQATLALYKTCLALRASEAAFRPARRDSWRVEELAMGVGAIHLQGEQGEWIVLFDLTGGHAGNLREEPLFQSGPAGWKVILSSNEVRFGGSGACGVDAANRQANFIQPETVVLQRA